MDQELGANKTTLGVLGPRIIWQPFAGVRHCYAGPELSKDTITTALCGDNIVIMPVDKGSKLRPTCQECNAAARELEEAEYAARKDPTSSGTFSWPGPSGLCSTSNQPTPDHD